MLFLLFLAQSMLHLGEYGLKSESLLSVFQFVFKCHVAVAEQFEFQSDSHVVAHLLSKKCNRLCALFQNSNSVNFI